MSQIISSGESSGSIILEYDSLIVESGGQVGYVELGEEASLDISGGGKVSSAFASGLYTEIMVRSGGNLSEANVGLGAWTTVYSGGSVTGIVEDGGWVEVMNGAEVEFVPHVISMLVLTADQYATVHSATTVSSAYVTGTKYSGGMLEVCEGATLSNITVKSNGQVDARGYIYDVMVQDSGYVNAVTNTMEHVQIYNGGYGAVYSMGAGSDVTIYNGGSCNVNGGRATLTEVSSGGSFTVQNCSDSETGSAYQGVADLTTVRSGGVMRLISGGSAGHTTVGNGGLLELLRGGTATNVVATAGANLKFDFSPDTYIQGTMDGYDFELKDGILSSFLVKSQTLEVSSGGSFVGGTIGDSGSVVISSGAAAENTFVGSNGSIFIEGGGAAIGTIIQAGGSIGIILDENTHVEGTSGGRSFNGKDGIMSGLALGNGFLEVGSGCLAISTTVSGEGQVRVQKGGLASATTVGSGGSLTVLSGGKAQRVTIGENGHLTVSNGGTLTGRMKFEAGADVFMGNNATLDFDLTQTSAGGAALVNDLSLVQGTPLYTLTVTGTEEHGAYTLADGTAGFDGTITVKDTAGTDLGTLKVGGESLTIGDAAYTLVLADGSLSVTVSGATPPPIPGGTAKSDIDGNGVSDVMFVWTGEHGDGNYQHGYWMNGTSEWQSANSNHPAEWDNLGCYDMTGDGKADSVLFGNVTSEAGIHGAYIGYYADANDLPDGSTWVNIGYLTNENDILWKNAVGNLTGNASGVNSIVWYAPGMYALGAWTDGTENWVSMSSTFGGDDWTLIGCGDFDGDGRDSVLMAYSNGQMFYTVDIGGGDPQCLGSNDWSNGWEIRAIGDFSGNGMDDIILFHKDTGSMVLCADGNLDNFVSIGQLAANDWFVVGAGDYNGDQQDDLLVRQYSTGMLGYYASGDTTQWTELGRGVDIDWTVIA